MQFPRPSQQLTITALTSSGHAYDIDFPLHPQTRSSDAVADLVTAQLAAISEIVARHPGLGDGDILQSLAMTLAVRARMVDSSPESMTKLVHDLFDTAYEAARTAAPVIAGGA